MLRCCYQDTPHDLVLPPVLCSLILQERARAATGHKGPLLIVMRPRSAAINTQYQGKETHTTAMEEDQQQEASGGAAEGLVPVSLPTGSVRASLGPLSTWEDCWVLCRFLGSTFKDWSITSADIAAGEKLTRVVNEGEGLAVDLKAMISEQQGGDCWEAEREGGRCMMGDGI